MENVKKGVFGDRISFYWATITKRWTNADALAIVTEWNEYLDARLWLPSSIKL